jgi:hypothetical protein
MMERLKAEKQSLAKSKQPNQLNIDDAPKKIKIEKKPVSKIGSLFTNNTETRKQTAEITKHSNTDFKNWVLPSIELLDNRG